MRRHQKCSLDFLVWLWRIFITVGNRKTTKKHSVETQKRHQAIHVSQIHRRNPISQWEWMVGQPNLYARWMTWLTPFLPLNAHRHKITWQQSRQQAAGPFCGRTLCCAHALAPICSHPRRLGAKQMPSEVRSTKWRGGSGQKSAGLSMACNLSKSYPEEVLVLAQMTIPWEAIGVCRPAVKGLGRSLASVEALDYWLK